MIYLTVYPIPEQLDLKYQIQQLLMMSSKDFLSFKDILWYHAL